MKRIILITIFIFSVYIPVKSQIKDSIDFTVDVVSRYMWRGFDLGGPGIQPAVKWIMAKTDNHAFEIEGWGYSDFKGQTKEIDLTLTYKLLNKNLSFSLHDFWYVSGKEGEYFDYSKESTSHTMGAFLNYVHNLGRNKSLQLRWSTILYGNDKKVDVDGERLSKQAYSSYFELKYRGKLMADKYGWDAQLGLSPYKSPYYYEVEKFSVINMGLGFNREFDLGQNVYLIPSLLFTVNPAHEKAYMTLGITTIF